MFNFLKKKPPAPRPIYKLDAPPENYIIVVNGCSIKMLEALHDCLRWNSKDEIDYGSLRQGWWKAFEILKEATGKNLDEIGIELNKPNN